MLFQDALKLGGAPIELRLRRFASLVRGSDPDLAAALVPLVSDNCVLRRAAPPENAPIDADSKLQLLRSVYPVRVDPVPVFGADVLAAFEQIVAERRAADRLSSAGLAPAKSVLLSGPPGVGKTLGASWLAQELDLPLLTLDLATVMSSYLGKTGANIRMVLEHAQRNPCVLLLDEFDAIAKRRDDEGDVGELKRLVTVLLQAVDDWEPGSLLVAATNHPELLDPAIWRRFDVSVRIDLPMQAERRALLAQKGVPAALAELAASLMAGFSAAILEKAVVAARKAHVIRGVPFDKALLEQALTLGAHAAAANDPGDVERRDVEVLLLHFNGRSAREIARDLSLSHTTINRTLRRYKAASDARTEPAAG